MANLHNRDNLKAQSKNGDAWNEKNTTDWIDTFALTDEVSDVQTESKKQVDKVANDLKVLEKDHEERLDTNELDLQAINGDLNSVTALANNAKSSADQATQKVSSMSGDIVSLGSGIRQANEKADNAVITDFSANPTGDGSTDIIIKQKGFAQKKINIVTGGSGGGGGSVQQVPNKYRYSAKSAKKVSDNSPIGVYMTAYFETYYASNTNSLAIVLSSAVVFGNAAANEEIYWEFEMPTNYPLLGLYNNDELNRTDIRDDNGKVVARYVIKTEIDSAKRIFKIKERKTISNSSPAFHRYFGLETY